MSDFADDMSAIDNADLSAPAPVAPVEASVATEAAKVESKPVDPDAEIDAAMDAALEAAEKPEGPLRGEDGRFQSQQADAKPGEAPAEAPKADAAADPFADWHDDWKGKFTALPPEQQSLVSDSHKVMHEHYGQQLQTIEGEFKAFHEKASPYVETVGKHQAYLDRVSADLQIPSHEIVGNLMAVENTLRYGTYDQKHQMIATLAKDYGVDLSAELDPFAEPTPEQHRTIHDQKQLIAELQHRLGQHEHQTRAANEQRLTSHIAAFSSATDQHGSPKYPLYAAVQGTMSELLTSGKAQSMEQAYAMAAKPIEDMIAKRSAPGHSPQTQAAAIAKAKRAVPVRASNGPRGVRAPTSVDAVIDELFPI